MHSVPITSLNVKCLLFLVKNHWIILCPVESNSFYTNVGVSLQFLVFVIKFLSQELTSGSVQIHINLMVFQILNLSDINFSWGTWCSLFPMYLLLLLFILFFNYFHQKLYPFSPPLLCSEVAVQCIQFLHQELAAIGFTANFHELQNPGSSVYWK